MVQEIEPQGCKTKFSSTFLFKKCMECIKSTNIMKDINEVEYCKPGEMENAHYNLILKVAQDMVVRNIDKAKIEGYIGSFRDEQKNQNANDLYDVLNNFLRTYSSDYSTSNINEATLVRDTVDNIFKVYFPNTITKSVGADAMISDSSKRFTELDPSFDTCGKHADLSVVSNKEKHILLSLEAKSNKTKGVDELVKLCRELKDTIKAINGEGSSDTHFPNLSVIFHYFSK